MRPMCHYTFTKYFFIKTLPSSISSLFKPKNPTKPFLDLSFVSFLWWEGERGSKMMSLSTTRSVLKLTGNVINEVISFIVFLALDLLDVILCVVFKLLDFFIEAEWKSCYCSYSSAKDHAITSCGKILVSEKGESNKIIRLSSSKVQLEEISDTLFRRPSLVSEISKSTVMIKELNRLKIKNVVNVRSTFTINSTIIEMLQGKIGRQHVHDPIPRWSDCDCKTCSSWTNSSCKDTLYVRTQGPRDRVKEDVLFIHGFISSSSFWTETLFPNFSKETKSSYRLMAVDLLGFGRSPKPSDSLYTLREHIEMIERSVIDRHRVKSFHLVAHSLGCILALAIAVKHPGAIKSITLLAPPYFPVPKEEEGAASQYIMRRIAPRRVWPLISFGSSIVCWYEHIQRTICLLICKHHRLWEFLAKLVVRNRIRTYLVEAFMCHTHNAAWHTVHNVIFGSGSKVSKYLDTVRDKLNCPVNVFHGQDDELVPVECSYSVGSRVPRANVKVMKNIDHITIVVGRQKAFARELEEIWKNSSR